jgi:two-component system sensor histidine kinase PilS (NtrC family)
MAGDPLTPLAEGTAGAPPAPDRTPALLPAQVPAETHEVLALKRRLLWISMLRLVSIVVLGAATILFTAGSTSSYLQAVRDTLVWVAVGSLIPALVYYPIVNAIFDRRRLLVVAKVQVVQDCLFSAFLVSATGGTGSAFTFFFSLTIVVAGTLAGRFGTVMAVTLSTGFMALLASFETGVLAAPPFLEAILAPVSTGSVLYSVGINIVAFVSIGFLSSYLAEALRRADIQREHYRANLEDLRQLHESILVSVEAGILTCRLDNRVVHMNRAAEDLIGISFLHAKGRSLFDILPEAIEPLAGSQHRFDMERKRADGLTVSLLVTVTPLLARTGDRIGRILVVDDVTVLRQLEARMKADERLATIGKLSAVVAHEIRNPLATISASAQMLTMSGGVKDEDRRMLDIVVREADRLNLWISELLDYARPRKGEMVALDLTELVGQCLEIVKGDPAGARVHFTADLEPGVKVNGDPQRLHRVFLNLGKNALEAMSGGGWLQARCWSEWHGSRRWAVVTIVDNGSGIAPEDRVRIFDAFFTTKAMGTGLGLAVVQQVVEEHGGTVAFQSEPNVRTEFRVQIPM